VFEVDKQSKKETHPLKIKERDSSPYKVAKHNFSEINIITI
jgi:hypothetical protein